MYPRLLYIEPTNLCASHCYFCPSRVGDREKGFMSLGLYKKIVDDLFMHRLDEPTRFNPNFVIYIQGVGSPLLSKDLFDMIRYTKKRNIKIGLSTNAQALNKANAEKLLKAGIDVVELSVYALNREEYLHIHGVDRMEQVFRNVIRFLHLSRDSSSIETVANIMVSKRALSEVSFLNWLYVRLPFHKVKNILIRNFHGMFEETGLTDEIEFLSNIKHGLVDVPVISDMIGNKSQISKKKKEIEASWEKPHWQCPWNSAMIFWDGDVDPCVTDYGKRYIVGNVKEERIFEIWNNDRYRRFRRAVINDDEVKDIGFEFCNNCSYYSHGEGASMTLNPNEQRWAFLTRAFPLDEEEEWLNTLKAFRQAEWKPIRISYKM